MTPFTSLRALSVVIIFGLFLSADPISSDIPPSVLFELLALNRDLPTTKFPKYRSPANIVASPDKSNIYICEQTAKRIAVFSLASESITGYIHLPNEVTGCAVSADGTTLYATCSSDWWPAGCVCVVNTATQRVTSRIGVGFGARSPVLTPDGTKLFVCNQYGNSISVIDLVSGAEHKIDVVREPYAADITPDGSMLVVGNLLPDDLSTDTNNVSCMITLFDVANDTVFTDIRLTHGSQSLFGLTVSVDGKYAFATHLIDRFYIITDVAGAGWQHTNNLAVIDLEKRTLVNDVCLDFKSDGLGNPWGVKCSNNGEFIAIAHAGSNELSLIQYQPFIDTVLARTSRGIDMQRDFTSMLESRVCVPVETKGPRDLVIIGNLVYTAGYFDDEGARMERYTVKWDDTVIPETYVIGESRTWNGLRHGESNFYDASLCFQNWQSCHSCHPMTRTNALNWILTGGAITAPKNTRSMLYSWWTPPVYWDGRRYGADTGIRKMIQLELFQAPSDEIARPLDTLLMYLKPTASPHLEKGKLTENTLRGKELFYNKDKVDCIICHPPPLFTDNLHWNTTIPDQYDANPSWCTPALKEMWRTAPYGHLGSFTLREIVEYSGHSTNASELTEEEMNDLLEYVLSL